MPDIGFQVLAVESVAAAASPLLMFSVRIANANPSEPIQNIALRCQIRIEANRRRYSEAEQARLVDLFGEPERWSTTVGSLLWTHANVTVPEFEDEAVIELPVPCTFDFNVASTKYFAGLEDGELPLDFQFSGTAFYRNGEGLLQVMQIPWDQDIRFRLPVRCWQEMMAQHYPNSAWLQIRKDLFVQLEQFKSAQGIAQWEQVFERLLANSEERVEP